MIKRGTFGKAPAFDKLELISQSSHYKNGKFHNISFTPTLVEGYSYWGVIYKQFFKKDKRRRPTDIIPSIKTNLHNLPTDEDVLVWFGHSSYFIKADGNNFLIDPVFSGNASPINGTNKSFKGSDVYTVADMPFIDFLLITHDHYDHLDHDIIVQLKDKVGKVICGLGVGTHFEHWGYPSEKIVELDWYADVVLDDQLRLFATPSRHFSGRSFTRNNTLWVSYVLETSSLKLYLGGDSGYDTHFADIGRLYGPFDLALLDNGQYNEAWRYIHMMPDEGLKAAEELGVKRLMPVHSGKFAMANHAWDEPLSKISALNNGKIPLVTPMIGEVVYLRHDQQQFKQWWKGLK
ncbi:MAG: MBL fold metallo-hydrolase [Proteobacteria bacterium]|nr:MAG: MBL fold metallo-hydrolase [Pseudomonadota bacterium]